MCPWAILYTQLSLRKIPSIHPLSPLQCLLSVAESVSRLLVVQQLLSTPPSTPSRAFNEREGGGKIEEGKWGWGRGGQTETETERVIDI